MRYALSFLFAGISFVLSAQPTSIGVSAGFDYWMRRPTFYQTTSYRPALSDGMFVRFGRKRWSYEAALQHSGYHDAVEYNEVIYDGPGEVFVKEQFKTDILSLGLKGEYRLNNSKASRLNHCIGIQIAAALLAGSSTRSCMTQGRLNGFTILPQLMLPASL